MQGSSVMTLSNSIIGVSILAMPFCFQQCGIILSLFILFFTSIISRLACHFLLKSAVIAKRKNFELLAFDIFGPAGKTVIELSIVGFLMGSCVAFFVVVGDLGPAIIKSALNLEMSVQALRPALLIGVAVFIVLPLGLIRDIDSLSSVCAISIAFYIILVLRIILEATPPIFASSWADKVNYWRPAGILQCLPIFSSALSCQTQLFEIFGSYLNGPLEKINSAIKSSVNMCTAVYMGVGLFGYIAFCSQPLTGNALMNFPPSFSADIMKLSFIVSVALSFPLVIFPCRNCLHSFLYHQTHSPHYDLLGRDNRGSSQSVLTLLIVTISLILALLVPSIELVLGLLGSTIGVILCYILPSVFFTRLLKKNTNERLLAQVVIVVGVFIMVLGTYANLFAAEEAMSGEKKDSPLQPSLNVAVPPEKDPLPEMNVGLEEPKRQVDELFQNEQQKLLPDQVKSGDDVKKDSDQVKSVGDTKKNLDQVNLVGDIKKESDPVKLLVDIEKETRKEPLEPVEPPVLKKVVVEDEQLKIPESNKKPDDSQYSNRMKSESADGKEILVKKSENTAEKSKKIDKSAEKQIENPNENKENLAPPLIVESQKISTPKARKVKKPSSLSETGGSKSVLPPSKNNKNAMNNSVNVDVNLKSEIMDKLKDTVPLPIALQKNINVFNLSVSQNAEVLKNGGNGADKVMNRDLLGQKKVPDLLDRERRDVDVSFEKILPAGKEIVKKPIDNKLTGNENELLQSAKLAVRSIEPAEKIDVGKLTAAEKDALRVGDQQAEDSIYLVEGNVEKVNDIGEKSISLVSEMVDVLIGDITALNVEVKKENIDKQDVLLAQKVLRMNKLFNQAPGKKVRSESPDQSGNKKVTDQSSKSKKVSQVFGEQVESDSADQSGNKKGIEQPSKSKKFSETFDKEVKSESVDHSGSKKVSEQSSKFKPVQSESSPIIAEPSKLDHVNESPSKGGTLKEVLKNSNSASGKGEESCPKNKTSSEAAASNKTQQSISTGDEQSARLNIQSVGHLSNPDNLLENLKVVDTEIRDAFPDVAKPLKRDLKSLEENLASSEIGNSSLNDKMKLFAEQNSDDVNSSKKIEIKDNR